MFELLVTQRFKASHAIRTFSGDFEPIHTHDWRVDVSVVGCNLDATGCVVDFALIQRHLREILSTWDGKVLNELSMFLDFPPSTEFLAKCLYDQLGAVLSEDGVRIKKVTVWETDNCSASYVTD